MRICLHALRLEVRKLAGARDVRRRRTNYALNTLVLRCSTPIRRMACTLLTAQHAARYVNRKIAAQVEQRCPLTTRKPPCGLDATCYEAAPTSKPRFKCAHPAGSGIGILADACVSSVEQCP